ncbi:MAG: choice-of-anchor J domain-containing protein [Bacteroidetes bacterium]|nr:choice-of-anchor J domain-containing protein [Bacteroidota bacterium]MCL2302659.1 choice-of-anchor J domain-containing protein [Lentimicrobiaceae bacterium]
MKKLLFIATILVASLAVAAQSAKSYSTIEDDCTISNFPWHEGFEDANFPPDCWEVYIAGNAQREWERNVTKAHSGEASAAHRFAPNLEGWLITPKLAIPNTEGCVLEFWSFTEDVPYYGYSGIWIAIEDNEIASFTELYQLEDVDLVESVWKKITILLDAYAGQDIYLGFKYAGHQAHIWYIDDIMISDASSFVDVELASIISPISGLNLTDSEPVKVSIKNNGSVAITEFTLKLELDGTEITTETYTESIAAFGQVEYTFSATLNLFNPGSYEVTVTAILDGDQIPGNDSKTITVLNTVCSTITTFPWIEDFEGIVFPPYCWGHYGTAGWAKSSLFAYESEGAAYHVSGGDQDSWLVTPQISVPVQGADLEFWSQILSPDQMDYSGVLISTSNGNPLFDTFVEVMSFSAEDDWQKITIPLNDYAGQDIYIGFRYMGDFAHAWAIDDIAVIALVPLTVIEFDPENGSEWEPFDGPEIHEYVRIVFSETIEGSSLEGITINGDTPQNVEINEWQTNILMIYDYYDWDSEFEIIIPVAAITGLANDIVYTFSTPAQLAIVALSPAANTIDATIDAEVSVTFNKNIFTNSTTTPIVTITKADGSNVGGVAYIPINPIDHSNKLIITHDNFEHNSKYAVTIPPYTVMGWSEPITWTFTTAPNSINENSHSNLFIYPNPTADKLFIKNDARMINNIRMFDVSGKLVREILLINNNKMTIDMSHLRSGVYFLNVDETTIKVVKQ